MLDGPDKMCCTPLRFFIFSIWLCLVETLLWRQICTWVWFLRWTAFVFCCEKRLSIFFSYFNTSYTCFIYSDKMSFRYKRWDVFLGNWYFSAPNRLSRKHAAFMRFERLAVFVYRKLAEKKPIILACFGQTSWQTTWQYIIFLFVFVFDVRYFHLYVSGFV